MDIHPIRNQRDHARALREIDRLWGAPPRTPAADKLEVLVTPVDAWESRHHPIDPPTPSKPSDSAWSKWASPAATWSISSGAAPAYPKCSIVAARSPSP